MLGGSDIRDRTLTLTKLFLLTLSSKYNVQLQVNKNTQFNELF